MMANIKDTAKALSVSEYFLRCEVKAARLPFYKSGQKYIFDIELVKQFLREKSMENVRSEESNNSSQFGTLKKIKE